MLLAIGGLACIAGSAAAGNPSDFGVQALQRAKESYVAGDPTAAGRNVVAATGVLSGLAESMGAPGARRGVDARERSAVASTGTGQRGPDDFAQPG